MKVTSDRNFRCDFPLLNPNEYFYVKVVADGQMNISGISCKITAENLPPKIEIESAAGVNIGPKESRDLTLLVPAGLLVLLGAVLALPLAGLYEVRPNYFPFAWAKFHFVWWLTIPIFLVGIIAACFAIGGLVMAVVACVGDIGISRRPRFKRPGRPYYPYMYHAHGFRHPQKPRLP